LLFHLIAIISEFATIVSTVFFMPPKHPIISSLIRDIGEFPKEMEIVGYPIVGHGRLFHHQQQQQAARYRILQCIMPFAQQINGSRNPSSVYSVV
jgi:hypothetical protein